MKTRVLEGGCIVCTSHKLNLDGYLRKHNNGRGLTMWHRKVWEDENGTIPDGYEIDHLCKNRACFNIEHLQMITTHDHRVKDNIERYADIIAEGHRLIKEEPNLSIREVADRLGHTYSRVYHWFKIN